jgi:hypothetical protein
MCEKCEFIDKCGFFMNYKGNSEVMKNGWVRLFCEKKEWSEKCERKIYRTEHGKHPADNMSPTGQLL